MTLISALVLLILLVYRLTTRKFKYWQGKSVPFPKPIPLLGNYGSHLLQRKREAAVIQEICQQFPDEPFVGAFYGTEPVFIPKDPDLLKLIIAKDFHYFSGREISDHCHKDPITNYNIFFATGEDWKVLKDNFSPLFTSSKLRNMFQLIANNNKKLEDLTRELHGKELEVTSLMARYTVDCAVGSIFGVDSNVLCNPKTNYFETMAKEMSSVPSMFQNLRFKLREIWPSVFYALGQTLFPIEFNEFFSNILKNVMELRKNDTTRKGDFIDSIMDLKDIFEKNEQTSNGMKMKLDDTMLVNHFVTFLLASFDTSSSALSYTLYELAKNLSCQNLACADIRKYLENQNGVLNYDCVTNIPYLSHCVDETLRLYPVVDVITREVRYSYRLPNGVVLEPGLRVHLPVSYLHHNEKHFPDPEMFRPERFSPEERKEITPYTYLPFGDGPRKCLGIRFAKMMILPALVTILKNYQVELAEGMSTQLKFEPTSLVIKSKEGIRLKFTKRE